MTEYDMEYHHCGHCGKYVSPELGFYGAAERKDGGLQRIYCDEECCYDAEGIECRNAGLNC